MSDKELLDKAIIAAREFVNFDDVYKAISLHPEWLTIIPENRQWAILHQVIYSGNVNHFMQLLNLQKTNKSFRLLTETVNKETALDIAKKRSDVPAMQNYIEKLIKLDEMLNYARDCQWDQCYNIVKENPGYFNEKPPYRRYYLIHQIAFADNIEQFQRFQQIKDFSFDFTLRYEKQKINVFARKINCITFATYLEKEYPFLLSDDDSIFEDVSKPPEAATERTKDVNIMVKSVALESFDEELLRETLTHKTRTKTREYLKQMQLEGKILQQNAIEKAKKEEDEKYKTNLLNNLKCPITMAVFVDPVIASDGCTYERSAITKWLEKNNLSPVTNEQMPDKNLISNTIIKQILNSLQPNANSRDSVI